MRRSIEICGAVGLCVAVTACAILPLSKNETSSTAAPEADSEAAVPAKAQDQPNAPTQRGARRENLTCFTGNEDRHARIGVELVNDQVTYFAYYSKARPRTCSIEAGRRDRRSRWTDNGEHSTVTLVDQKSKHPNGKLRIDHHGDAYRFAFFDVDRVRYCGMQGKINGSLTVTRGKSSCGVQGVMDGHSL